MSENLIVRRIRAGEGMRWRELRLRALADTPIAFEDTVEGASARPDSDWHDAAARLSNGGQSALFIAERADNWVGVAGGFCDTQDRTTIFSVFVDPQHRGGGVLEEVIEAVATWSESFGRRVLALEVAIENPRAHAAYRRLGFVATGQSRRHPLFPEITEVELQLPTCGVRTDRR